MTQQPTTSTGHLLVIGANGGIGRQCVQLGLAAGYQVTALLRIPSKLTLSHPYLRLVQGDVTQPATFAAHLADKDAILSTIGIPGGLFGDKPTTLYSQGAATILAEMKRSNGRRVFFISSAAIEISPVNSYFIRFMEKYVMGSLLKHMFADLRTMEATIKASDADWTIIRPPRLINQPSTGQYRYALNEFLPDCTQIVRADIAHFMLNHITDPSPFRTTVEIAY